LDGVETTFELGGVVGGLAGLGGKLCLYFLELFAQRGGLIVRGTKLPLGLRLSVGGLSLEGLEFLGKRVEFGLNQVGVRL
jgi:hypothetical protein